VLLGAVKDDIVKAWKGNEPVTRRLLITLSVLVLMAGLGMRPRRLVWTKITGTDVLWNDRACYIFIGQSTLGFRANTFRLWWSYLLEALGHPTLATHKKERLIVLQIMPAGDSKHEFLFPFRIFDVVDDSIVAALGESPHYLRWDPDKKQFVASDVDRRMVAAAFRGVEFDYVDGWSKRVGVLFIGERSDKELPLSLGATPLTLVFDKRDAVRRIAIIRPGIAPRSLVAIDQADRLVSREEFEHLFDGSKAR
jgi:hypothetical protein